MFLTATNNKKSFFKFTIKQIENIQKNTTVQ